MHTSIGFCRGSLSELYENKLRGSDLSNLLIEPIENKYNDFRQELKEWRNVVLPRYRQRIREIENESFRRCPATTFMTTIWLIGAPVVMLGSTLLGKPIPFPNGYYPIPTTIGAAAVLDYLVKRTASKL